jgi:branched-chain amino acid transport system ATP-binding protein
VLEVDAIHTYYDESHVLHGVSLRVAPGEAVALLGRNGAGKTTAIRSIVGFTPPRAGRVLFEGQAIERWPAYRIARRGLALVPQGRRIFAPLSVRENLLLGARASGWTLERVFGLFPRLRERQGQLGGTLSGGEQQMLAIGRALLTNPTLLLMDEPSEGLAPTIVEQLTETCRTLVREGLTLVLIEQNLGMATAVADRLLVIVHGEVALETTSSELLADEDAQRRYLGVEPAGAH